MRVLGATVTRPQGHELSHLLSDVRDEQVGVQCIAGVVTFRLEDGTLVEFDEVQLNGALFFEAHPYNHSLHARERDV